MTSWSPSEHARELEMLQRIDHRQVMAIDGWDPALPYFFLDDGEAESVRADVERGRFRCPLPGCTDPVFHFSRGGSYRDHFVHLHAPGVDHASPEAMAEQAVAVLERWFTLQGCDVVTHGVTHGVGGLSVTRAGDAPVPRTRVVIPWTELSRNHVARLVDDTYEAGFELMWFLGVPSSAAAEARHHAGNVVRLPSGPRYLRDQGVPLWLLNPVRRFGLGVEDEGVSDTGLLAFRAVSLWDCELDERGPVVPVSALATDDNPSSVGPGRRRSRRGSNHRRARRRNGAHLDSTRDEPAGPIEAALLKRYGIERIGIVDGPRDAADMIRGELGDSFAIDVIERMNLWELPALRSARTLLFVFAPSSRLAEVATALGQLDDRTWLLPRDAAFTYRELFDAVDMLDHRPPHR